ncbi:NAD(P)-dependent dehydrogenase (short-subunit alcohol dehydrogenase family) [Neobacillus niacini]|uniref:SDR family NAD(P)-dependent oxidoreductase n=1 Tax=Neobacillus niacini TaxID=86668 RepID=UPI00277D306A|nr:SDR family NAD(P)-dependent oxidoreductase [Neobacillus niacini]MDQ1002236.1 NAD(P)-dependent dehydrogenase (short-subunit alcohol dehydrogenase family) [Neobacillus niacini]
MGDCMELNLVNKNAVITGGSTGIGLSIAKEMIKEGINVLIVSRNKEHLLKAEELLTKNKLLKHQQVYILQCDLMNDEAAKEIKEKAVSLFGRIDILVNNAGSAPAGSFLELTDKDFFDAWNLKLFSHIRLTREISSQMIEQRKGKIVNIIGISGRTPYATFLPGSTTNAGFLNFTKGLSKALSPYNIHVNAISPGVTATERSETLANQNAKTKGTTIEEEKARVRAAIPLGNLVDPKEIAYMTLLLVSDIMQSITGTEITIDGGQQPGM